MEVAAAAEMLKNSGVDRPGPSTWADLGCGDGVFTRALASRLAPGSTIHAMDRDAASLATLPATEHGVTIRPHRGDFTRRPWPFDDVDGILMANALHFVADPLTFIRACAPPGPARPRFLIVEYDTDRPNRWVPHPLGRARLQALFADAGYASFRVLATRPSIYHRASIYAAAIDAIPE
jgi:ubiquinone/menaquinone biosynthesis C-methylase UbiE